MKMFTVAQIKEAHSKVKSGADFPKYIQEIKSLGVAAFETWVNDSHTDYSGNNNFRTSSKPMYDKLIVNTESNRTQFLHSLKIHQQGETDYLTFCQHCADAGIEKWIVDLAKMTCTYFDLKGNEVLVEEIPN